MFNYRETEIGDAALLDNCLRKEDREEILADSILSAEGVIEWCIKYSDEAWTYFYGDKLLAITGVREPDLLSDAATPWLLTGEELSHHGLYLVRQSKIVVNRWVEEYGVLRNYVDGRYLAALRWAKLVGFSVSSSVPVGPDRIPFYKIEIRK